MHAPEVSASFVLQIVMYIGLGLVEQLMTAAYMCPLQLDMPAVGCSTTGTALLQIAVLAKDGTGKEAW